MSRKTDLAIAAHQANLYVRTYSPGDGVTRYRFFKRERCSLCLDRPGYNGLGKPCKGCDAGYLPDDNGFFGPANGIYTALGLKEAFTFVEGALAHG